MAKNKYPDPITPPDLPSNPDPVPEYSHDDLPSNPIKSGSGLPGYLGQNVRLDTLPWLHPDYRPTVDQSNNRVQNDINDLLAYYAGDEDQRWSLEQTQLDWLKTLSDRAYNEQMTKQERAYAERILFEQRKYDSPAAQLARLMSTGLSYSQAVAMLQGSGSGGGSASYPNVPGVDASQSMQSQLGLSPSQSALNQMQTKLAPVNTACNVISTIGSLVSLGLNVKPLIASGQLAAAQAYQAQQTMKGLGLANQFMGNVIKAVDTGLVDYDTTGQDLNAVRSAMMNITPEQSPEIYDFMHGGAYQEFTHNTPALNFANDAFMKDWTARGYKQTPEDAQWYRRQLYATVEAAEFDAQAAFKTLALKDAELDLLFAQADNIAAQTAEVDERTKLIGAQIEQTQEETRLTRSNADLSAIALHRAQITREKLDNIALLDVSRDLQLAIAENSPESLQNLCDKIVNDAKYQNCLMQYNYLYYNNLDKLLEWDNTGNLLSLGQIMHDCHLQDYLLNSMMRSYDSKFMGASGYVGFEQSEKSYTPDNMNTLLMSFGIDVDEPNLGRKPPEVKQSTWKRFLNWFFTH